MNIEKEIDNSARVSVNIAQLVPQLGTQFQDQLYRSVWCLSFGTQFGNPVRNSVSGLS
jgi:hypothetical protein